MKRIGKLIVAAVIANTAALIATMIAIVFISGPDTKITGSLEIWAGLSIAVLAAGFVIMCGAAVWELMK